MVNMSLRELFPVYPLILKSPPRSRTKFGTRHLYVDLPWLAYYFMELGMRKAAEADLTTKVVRKEWKEFLQHYKTFLTLDGKPFVSVSLRPERFSGKKLFMLNVKWALFIKYLEKKAKSFMLDVESDGKNVMKVYKEIWVNFFSLRREVAPPEPAYFPSAHERFRKLLKRTGDYSYLRELLNQLENTVKLIGEAEKKKIPSIQLYSINLRMDVQHLRTLIDNVNIPAAYLLLRNVLENLIKLFVYLDIGKSFDPDLVLSTMFLYEYETAGKPHLKKRRRYSLKKFKNEFAKKFLKIHNAFSSNEPLDLFELINKLKEKQISPLGVNPKLLKEFSDSYGLDGTNINELYSACSEVIHNQPPLPFFSLLELKFFKFFLEGYMHSLRIIVEKLTNRKIQPREIHVSSTIRDEDFLKKCLRTAYLLEKKYDLEIKDIVKRAAKTLQINHPEIFVEPLTLISLFHLISPSLKRLRSLSFVEEDLKDIIEKLQPLSFKISIQNEIEITLIKFQEIILPELEKYAVFSSVKSMEQKRKVAFYLLLHYLPKVVEE